MTPKQFAALIAIIVCLVTPATWFAAYRAAMSYYGGQAQANDGGAGFGASVQTTTLGASPTGTDSGGCLSNAGTATTPVLQWPNPVTCSPTLTGAWIWQNTTGTAVTLDALAQSGTANGNTLQFNNIVAGVKHGCGIQMISGDNALHFSNPACNITIGGTLTTSGNNVNAGAGTLLSRSIAPNTACTATGNGTMDDTCRDTANAASTTMTFSFTHASVPQCILADEAGGSTPAITTISTTQLIFTSTSGHIYDIHCFGN